jgi:hypothetical protein
MVMVLPVAVERRITISPTMKLILLLMMMILHQLQQVLAQPQNFPGRGSITGSGAVGAGSFYSTSRIPLAIFQLNKCTSVAPHIHPNGAETVFALKGTLRVVQFRGEEAGTNVSEVIINKGEAAYIQQGELVPAVG